MTTLINENKVQNKAFRFTLSSRKAWTACDGNGNRDRRWMLSCAPPMREGKLNIHMQFPFFSLLLFPRLSLWRPWKILSIPSNFIIPASIFINSTLNSSFIWSPCSRLCNIILKIASYVLKNNFLHSWKLCI